MQLKRKRRRTPWRGLCLFLRSNFVTENHKSPPLFLVSFSHPLFLTFASLFFALLLFLESPWFSACITNALFATYKIKYGKIMNKFEKYIFNTPIDDKETQEIYIFPVDIWIHTSVTRVFLHHSFISYSHFTGKHFLERVRKEDGKTERCRYISLFFQIPSVW